MKMNKYPKCIDINAMKILYFVGNVLGMVPIFDFKTNKTRKSNLHLIYSIILFATIVFVNTTSQYYKHQLVHPVLNTTSVVLDVLSNNLLLMINGFVVFKHSIMNKKDFQNFMESLIKFDKESNILPNKLSNKRFNITNIIFYNVIFFTYHITDSTVWLGKFDIVTFSPYLFAYFQMYHMLTLAFIMNGFLVIIKDRFVYLNHKLFSILIPEKELITVVDVKRKSNNWRKSNDVKDVIKFYTFLCEIVEMFNNNYGYPIVFLLTTLVIGLLQPINIGLVYTSAPDGIDGMWLGMELAFLCFLWCLVFFVSATQ